jgi:hypothetical protein
MRLLDLIAQARSIPIHSDDGRALPTADRFKNDIRACPLRYVLSDELVRCATQLAYAEGDRLSACLDLIHVPSWSVWVEWADAPRRHALAEIPTLAVRSRDGAQRGGALVTAVPDCRSGQIRTFWSMRDDTAYLSPVVTEFNLDGIPEGSRPAASTAWRGDVFLTLEDEPAIAELLAHLRFHFDDEWAAYYRARCRTGDIKDQVVRASLGGVAFDAPMLLAFFLLLGATNLLPRRQAGLRELNSARQRAGRALLLEHVEVAAPLSMPRLSGRASDGNSTRSGPRLHHVRGHIVRRGATVFWRSPHLRGSMRLGRVRSRTVELSFTRPSQSLESGSPQLTPHSQYDSALGSSPA